ncbi:MAG: hypothetical protein EOL95_08925 [Bacteroidia bacterium]|nr:hypothetical protein [Bacteroidia bacterium]
MKKNLILLFTLLLSLNIFAKTDTQEQNNRPKRLMVEEELEFYKTKELLSNTEFDKFAVVYKELSKQKQAIRNENRILRKQSIEPEISEESATKILNAIAINKIRIAQLNKDYQDKILEIIPATKYLKIQQARDEYKREIWKKIKEQRTKGNKQQH